MSQPLVLVAPDVRAFQGYDWHAAPDSYLTALVENAGVTPWSFRPSASASTWRD